MDGICTDSMNLVDFYGKLVGKIYNRPKWIGMGYRNSKGKWWGPVGMGAPSWFNPQGTLEKG